MVLMNKAVKTNLLLSAREEYMVDKPLQIMGLKGKMTRKASVVMKVRSTEIRSPRAGQELRKGLLEWIQSVKVKSQAS